MEGWLIFICVIGAIWFIVWLNNRLSNLREQAKKYVELKPKLDNLDKERRVLESKENKLESKEANLRKHEEDIGNLVKEKTEGFPWLAQAYADYLHLQDYLPFYVFLLDFGCFIRIDLAIFIN